MYINCMTTSPTPQAAFDPAAMQGWMQAQTEIATLQQELMQALASKSGDFQKYGLQHDPMALQKSVMEYWSSAMRHPEKIIDAQIDLWTRYMELCQATADRLQGKREAPPAPAKPDRRFKDERWTTDPLLNHLHQSYNLMSSWMQHQADALEKDDPAAAKKMRFAMRQYMDALSPSNFWMTNPEVLDETIKTGGQNLVNGLRNMIADIKDSKTLPKISMVKKNLFAVGKNLATTKGAVVFENDVLQIIQYAPLTEQVYKTPLVIVSPWINKFYILDMQPENSFVKWAIEQGHTVFITSWKNVTAKDRDLGWFDYMQRGLIAAIETAQKATGEEKINVIGYCIGGTLLTTALAYWKAKGKESPVKSATFFTALIDFKDAGDMMIFTDEEQITAIEKMLDQVGFLDAWHTHTTFNMLRSNDLIWSFVVNNYLLGREPFPFDLLYWNSDSTRIPAKLHSFYLRQMYLYNNLSKPGKLVLNKTKLDVTKIDTPSYFISAVEDHIAPWKATYAGAKLLGGDVTFTLSGSGHIAGIVNPPAKNKYGYWTNEKPADTADAWLQAAQKHEGSWWSHWANWIAKFGGDKVLAREIKKSIEAAPGRYVKVRAL